MYQSKSIQIKVPVSFAIQTTWQMHFQQNSFTQNTYPHHQNDTVCNRQVHLLDGNSVRQKITLDKQKNCIQYENIAGNVQGDMVMTFQSMGQDANLTRLTAITYSRTKDGKSFPTQDQLQEGLKISKKILQARYKLEQQMPKCCQCKLFG